MKKGLLVIFFILPLLVCGQDRYTDWQRIPLTEESKPAMMYAAMAEAQVGPAGAALGGLSIENQLAEERQKSKSHVLAAVVLFLCGLGLVLLFVYRNKQQTEQQIRMLNEMKSRFFAKILDDDNLSFSFADNALSLDVALPLDQQLAADMPLDGESPTLLIVDDNDDIRNLLKELFEAEYMVLEAKNGFSALELAQRTIPDCIISDVMMPGMDGFEFTKRIKRHELTSFIPVIMLTAKSTEDAHLESLTCMADTFITKPFHNEILKETVACQIAERKRLRERYSRELILKPTDIAINAIDEQFLEKVGAVMNEHLTDADFSADAFASALGMSRMQLHRKLKSLLNMSTSEFIRNERMKSAIALLDNGHFSVSEVAYAVGFNDVSYFSKCFKAQYCVTPTEYIQESCN